MSECNIKIDINSKFEDLIDKLEINKMKVADGRMLESTFIEKYKKLIEQKVKSLKDTGTVDFTDLNNVIALNSVINDLFKDSTPAIQIEFSPENNRNFITDLIFDKPKEKTNTENITLEFPKLDDKGLDPKFLEKFFTTSLAAKVDVTKRAKALLANAMLYNRKSGKLITDESTLNAELRELQQTLWEEVLNNYKLHNVEWLNNFMSNDKESKLVFKSDSYKTTSEYDKYSKRFRDAFNIIHKSLPDIYQGYINGNNKDVALYKAYSSFILLDNFDDLVKSILGDNIEISFPRQKRKYGKYKFAEKGANKITSWSDNDVVDWNDYLENTTRLLIETSPIVDRKGRIHNNKFLKTNEFAAVISSIKEGALKHGWFELSIIDNFPIEELSPVLRSLIEIDASLTLGDLIGRSVQNPGYYMPIIFDFFVNHLKNEKFFYFKQEIGIEGVDLIHTIYHNFFKQTYDDTLELNSLFYSSVRYNHHKLYDDLIELTSSTAPIQLLQRYVNPSGDFANRTFDLKGVDGTAKNFKDTVNIVNSSRAKGLNLEPYLSKSVQENIQYDDTNKQFTIFLSLPLSINGNNSGDTKYYDFSYQISKDNKTGLITHSKNEPDYNDIDVEKSLAKFVGDVLSIDFLDEHNELTLLYETYKEQNHEGLNLNNGLGKLALNIMTRTLLKNHIIELNDGQENKKNVFPKYKEFVTNATIYTQTKSVDLFINEDYPFFEKFVDAFYLYKGGFSRSINTDGSGNAQSRFTKSRMASQLENQFSAIRQNTENVAHEFSLFTMVKGIYNVKETQLPDGTTRATTEQNLGELFYGSFFLDFISSFIYPETSRNLVKHGQAAVYPATAADKSSYFNLLIKLPDVYKETIKNPKESSSKRLQTWIDIREQQTKPAYQKLSERINTTWYKIATQLGLNIEEGLAAEYIIPKINELAKNKNKKPLELALEGVRDYNTNNPKDHIKLYENLMYEKDSKGNLVHNQSLNYYLMYNMASEIINSAEDIADTLIDNNITFNVNLHHTPEIKYLADNFPDFVDKSGNIMWKIEYEESHTEIHPLLLEWNAMGSVISEQFKFTTVGTSLNHPAKGKFQEGEVHKMNAARINAQTKRNSALTATMDQVAVQTRNGVPKKVKVAVMEELLKTESNLSGDINTGVNVHDGATFGTPFFTVLMNNSLGSASAGQTLKIYTQSYVPELGIGQNLKTALFTLRNYHLRNSFFQRRLLKKMTDIKWEQAFEEHGIDLPKEGIDITNGGKNFVPGNLFFKRENKYYLVKSLSKNKEANKYNVEYQEVDEHGQIQDNPIIEGTYTIQSNYQLYQILGGWNSMSLVDGELQYSDASVHAVVHYINNNGVTINQNNILKVKKVKSWTYNTQDNIFQFMKHSDIQMAPTKGALKQGIANINSAKSYYDTTPLQYMMLDLTNAGVQLDKEHFSEELSQSNQMLIASALGGLTFKYSEQVQKALKLMLESASNNISSLFKDVPEMDVMSDKQKELLINTMKELIIKNIAKDGINPNNFLSQVAIETVEALKSGKHVDFDSLKIPLSDPTLYNKVITSITTFLNKNGIRNKLPGILGVLTPSNGIFKLYGDSMLSDFEDNSKDRIEKIQRHYNAHPVYEDLPESYLLDPTKKYEGDSLQEGEDESILLPRPTSKFTDNRGDIELGRVYQIIYYSDTGKPPIAEYHKIEDPLQRAKFIEKLESSKGIRVVEYVQKQSTINPDGGRDLASYNIKFKDATGKSYNIFDIKELLDCFKHTQIKDYNKTVDKQLRHAMWEVLDGITKAQETHQPFNVTIIEGGKEKVITINPDTIDVKAFEIIMPAVFKDRFNLKQGDSVGNIINDPNFFTERLKEIVKPTFSEQFPWEYEIKTGAHNIVITTFLDDHLKYNNLSEVEIQTEFKDGELWRVSPEGEFMYKLSQQEVGPDKHLELQDKVYRTEDGKEILVTKDPNFYIKDHIDSTIIINPNIFPFKQQSDSSEELKDKDKKGTKINSGDPREQRLQQINKEKDPQLKRKLQEAYHIGIATLDPNIDPESKEYKIANEYFAKKGRQMHTSFLKHLEVVVGRIPAQSMQSYMAMKIVGFENAQVNNLMVSAAQIWLQGSDYDIDAGNVFMYKPNHKGVIETWNKFADYSSLKTLDESMTFPFPNGITPTVVSVSEDKVDQEFLSKLKESIDNSTIIDFSGLENNETTVITAQIALAETLALNNGHPDLSNLAISSLLKFLINRDTLYEINSGRVIIDGKKTFNVDDIIKNDIKLISDYNTYLNKVKDRQKENIFYNFLQYNFRSGIISPTNQIQAQTPIDVVTEGLKQKAKSNTVIDKENQKLSESNYLGNHMQFANNHQGKDGISITAVGTKNYGTLSYSMHKILNSGDAEKIKTLASSKGEEGHKFLKSLHVDQQTLQILKEAHPEIAEHLENQLKSNNAIDDISAFMSLSVDNAKELALAALNAGSLTLGIYMYAVSMGYNPLEIADVLMSSIGSLIIRRSKGNVFTGNRNAISLDSVFSKIERFLDTRDYFKGETGKALKKILDHPIGQNTKESINSIFFKLVVSQPLAVRPQEFRDKLQIARNATMDLIGESGEKSLIQLANKLFDDLEQDLEDKILVSGDYASQDQSKYSLLKTLFRGAEEMRSFSSILGLNNGLPTTNREVLNKIKQIESISRKRQDAILKDKLLEQQWPKGNSRPLGENHIKNVDLYQFTHSEEYRNEVIKEYESLKHSFNIWEMLSQVDSFMGYLGKLSEAHESLKKASNRYALTYEASNILADITDQDTVKGRENIYRGVGTYYSENIRNYFFKGLEDKITGEVFKPVTVKIDAGQHYFETSYLLSESPYEQDIELQLGTPESNATFLKYFSEQIIPDLKRGYIGKNEQGEEIQDSYIANNKFIKDLKETLYTKTVSRNATQVWSLPVNLSPHTEEERSRVQDYVIEVDKLANTTYKGMKLIDLFALYDLIMFSGRQGQVSWDNLLVNHKTEGLFKRFHNFEAYADKNQMLKLDLGQDLSGNVVVQDIVPFVAPIGNPYYSKSTYILYTDPATNETKLYQKRKEDNPDMDNDDYGIDYDDTSKYRVADGRRYYGLDYKYFPGYIQMTVYQASNHKSKLINNYYNYVTLSEEQFEEFLEIPETDSINLPKTIEEAKQIIENTSDYGDQEQLNLAKKVLAKNKQSVFPVIRPNITQPIMMYTELERSDKRSISSIFNLKINNSSLSFQIVKTETHKNVEKDGVISQKKSYNIKLNIVSDIFDTNHPILKKLEEFNKKLSKSIFKSINDNGTIQVILNEELIINALTNNC